MYRHPRTAVRWFVAVGVVALAGIAVDAAQALRPIELSAALRPHTSRTAPGRPIQAAVVLQKQDCSGNLRVLDLVHRRRVRDQLSLRVIWYAGPAGDSSYIRNVLPPWTRHIPLLPLERSLFSSLEALGHSTTPLLIVLDQDDRVRFVSQSPRSSREVAGLSRIIDGLTWIEEL